MESTAEAEDADSENKDVSDESDEDEEPSDGEDFRKLLHMFGLHDEDEEGDEEEDEDAQEFDVEEIDYKIPGDLERVVKLRVGVFKEPEFEGWLKNIHIRCTLNGKDVVAWAVGKYIHRGSIVADFWRDMEEPSQDMAEVAFEVFNRYDCLKSKFKDHIIQRGNGAWGEELDNGPLFLIERTHVADRDLQRKGLGRVMVNLLLRKAEGLTVQKPKTAEQIQFTKMFYGDEDFSKYLTLHTLVVPGWLRADVEPLSRDKSKSEKRKIFGDAADAAVAFYRALGFRRIGASSCLGYSHDPAHKSKAIEVAADFDLPEPEAGLSDDDTDDQPAEDKKKKELERLRQKHPLHHATITMLDEECVAFYETFLDNDKLVWKHTNRLQDNVLHVAAHEQKPESVKWLMDNANAGAILSSARNLQGYTPLEALQSLLETGRTRREIGMMTVDVSNRFGGFSIESVDCMALLAGLDPQKMSKLERQRLTFGCNCGECLEGFLSPRMSAALLFQGETIYDTLDMDIGNGSEWCQWFNNMFTYVAPDLCQNFRTNKSYRQGFQNMFKPMAECLRSNLVPVRANILMQWENMSESPPVTRSYLQRGGTLEGKIEPALRIAFEHAEEQSERTGDGEYERVMRQEVDVLKTCRNDDEFQFVASKCGLPVREHYILP
jgi:hypothetical protein